jgi:ArsR family transcriptional regulator, arsenate/arsenite/antimonite-responsive transcriptional repressor
MTAAYPLPQVVEPPTCCGDEREGSTLSTSPEGATVDAADALFKGFADPTRIRILNVLAAGELCVCDIVELLDVAQPAVSRHLAYLRRTGLVSATRDGKFAHYQLAPARDAVHQSLLACVVSCFRGIPSLDAERAAAVRRVADRRVVPC